MKQGIHPDYQSCIYGYNKWFQIFAGSTKPAKETIVWEDGNEYPLLKVEISSDTHPFYTGRQRFAQADGRGTFQKYGIAKL